MPTKELMMPVHPEDRRNVKGCPESVPMGLLNEAQAYSNHGQTLKRLAERGGLSIREMLAVINRRPYNSLERLSDDQALAQLNAALTAYRVKEEVDNG